MLVITPFARGSAYALHYALKGQPPQRNVIKDSSHVTAFDTMTEFPLDGPVLSFVLGGSDDMEIFYSTPSGINQASIDKAIIMAKPSKPKQVLEKKNTKKQKQAAAAPAPALQPAAPVSTASAVQVATREAPATRDVPAALEVPAHSPAAASPAAMTPTTVASPAVVGGITSDELSKHLKKVSAIFPKSQLTFRPKTR
jgi:hypothetical protein